MNLLASLPTVIGTAAIAPALLILWLVIAADERPGPAPKIWTAFALGATGAAGIPILGVIRALLLRFYVAPENPWAAQALHSVFGVALPEEAVKILVIFAVSARRRPFADPMDSVVYGAAAGLGFAAYENLQYLVQHAEMWRALAALRSVLTVPFHGALGVIAGAYLAIARSGTALGAHRRHRDWARLSSWMLVLLAPLGLHAAFDFPLLTLQQNPDRRFHHAIRSWDRASVADRLQFDRLCDPAGAARRPASRPAHRTGARTARPAAANVGVTGGRRRRRIYRTGVRADRRSTTLGGQSRSQRVAGAASRSGWVCRS